ncbi:MAG TPA: FtsX-like permease family protein [Terriglobales bacterium]|nr:FtsX-like permease family protein [Terriglobales bacterium]
MSSTSNSALLQRRRQAPHTSMFLRMLMRAAALRRGRALSALLAMIVAAAVATAMLNLYVDVQAKLRKEFRNYGANVVVVAKDQASLPVGALATVQKALAGRGLAVPFAYAVARTSDGQSVVVAGTDFNQVQKLNQWWAVSAWPKAANEALVGRRAAGVLGGVKAFDLTLQGRDLHLIPSGTLQTGSAEDSRVYISLNEFEAWAHVSPSTIEIAASGTPAEVDVLVGQLKQTLPDVEVRPVRQIMEGEARVLGKTRATLFAAAILIILTTALCVLSTLIGWVFDRRRDFAIMKALGASERLISGFFAAEAAALGAVGAVLGFALGVGIAAWIGRINFNAPVIPRFSILPAIFVGSVAVALLASLLPISLLRRVEPAMILRGE